VNTTARIRDWLEAADFNGEGCQHSYLTISLAVGCSRTHATRCIDELEAAGEIRVERAPRGSKRPNTYRVRGRNPRMRAPVLLRLAEVRKLRAQLCDSKGTAASKGSDPSGKDNRSNVVHQRCGRGKSRNLVRKEARTCFERSRGVPEPARRPDLRLVDDLYGIEGLAAECQRLRALVMVAFGLASTLRYERDVAEEDARQERKKARYKDAQIRRLRKQRQERLAEGANMELIQRLWEFHRKHIPGSHKLGVKTIEAVRARLADTAPESEEPAYSPRYIAEAVLGASDDQWARERGQATLERICSSPESLERFHGRFERRRRPVAEMAEKAMRENGEQA
jgi:hypothetical protein